MSWGYSDVDGPHTWAMQFPLAAGDAQSPVDIVTDDALYDRELEASPLRINYVPEDTFTAVNTGESFKINLRNKSEILGGPLNDVYRLEQFHLHWGSDDFHGSEHTINGQTFAAELHLVHWNCTKYSSFAEAVSKPDGLAVLGVMIQPGEEHEGFKDMVLTMQYVKQGGQSILVLKSFNPSILLPKNTKDIWTYHGSLTTPPCYESVQWMVFREPVQFSLNQLHALRGLLKHDSDHECIENNFRPPMPLGTRKIRASFT